MKTIKKDLKHGVISLLIENPEDLWHIEHVLEIGDLVKSKTLRKVSVKHGGEHKLSDKKPMTLKIELEKLNFDDSSKTLRLSGKIVEGPENTQLSSYHTLTLKPGTVFTVLKRKWSSYQLKRIEESRIKRPTVLICVLDRDRADFALLDVKLKVIGHIDSEDPENREKYHNEIMKFIRGSSDWERFVIAGPGFEAENVMKYVKDNDTVLSRKGILESSSCTGITGINEVIKKSGERVLRDTRIGEESQLVEEIMARIKTEGLVAYGKKEVEEAIKIGAVETIVVSREKLKEFDRLMEECEKMQGCVKLITSDHHPGEQFLHIGGIAALLRYKLK